MFCYKWVTSDTTFYLKTRAVNKTLVVNLLDSNRDYFKHGVVVKNWQYAPLTGNAEYQGLRCPPFGNGIVYSSFNYLDLYILV